MSSKVNHETSSSSDADRASHAHSHSWLGIIGKPDDPSENNDDDDFQPYLFALDMKKFPGDAFRFEMNGG